VSNVWIVEFSFTAVAVGGAHMDMSSGCKEAHEENFGIALDFHGNVG
jgi:hypothetical protein